MDRPTLQQLYNRITADISTTTGTQLLPTSLQTALAAALTGSAHGQYGYIDYLAEQMHPLTCNEHWLGLWAQLYSITRLPAQAAHGEITLNGTDGTVIAAQTAVRKGEVAYTTTATTTIANSTATAPVQAVDVGTHTHQPIGIQLNFSTPIVGVDTQVTVVTAIAGGADQESLDAYRARVNQAFVAHTTLGSREDYAKLARLAHSDVATAWVYPRALGLGTVVLRIITDDITNQIPSQTVLDTVANYIHANQPAAAADVRVLAPSVQILPITIATTALTADEQAQCATALAQMVQTGRTPEQTVRTNDIRNVIDRYTLDYTLVAPTADATANQGAVWQLGVAWQS